MALKFSMVLVVPRIIHNYLSSKNCWEFCLRINLRGSGWDTNTKAILYVCVQPKEKPVAKATTNKSEFDEMLDILDADDLAELACEFLL